MLHRRQQAIEVDPHGNVQLATNYERKCVIHNQCEADGDKEPDAVQQVSC